MINNLYTVHVNGYVLKHSTSKDAAELARIIQPNINPSSLVTHTYVPFPFSNEKLPLPGIYTQRLYVPSALRFG